MADMNGGNPAQKFITFEMWWNNYCKEVPPGILLETAVQHAWCAGLDQGIARTKYDMIKGTTICEHGIDSTVAICLKCLHRSDPTRILPQEPITYHIDVGPVVGFKDGPGVSFTEYWNGYWYRYTAPTVDELMLLVNLNKKKTKLEDTK